MGVRLLTVAEVASVLRTSKQLIRKMIQEGVLPAVKVGREWRISEAYLEEFLTQMFQVS